MSARLPLQNRVAPDGSLQAVAARGLFYGNRGGRFHDPVSKALGGRLWASRQWICCRLEFKGRRKAVWSERFTDLFFADEVTALAAGHRPCFECRREDALAFAAAVARGLGFASPLRATELDLRLDVERRNGREKRLHRRRAGGLPDGAMFMRDGEFLAVQAGRALAWRFDGYGATTALAADALVAVLTPPTSLLALAAGYRPIWRDRA